MKHLGLQKRPKPTALMLCVMVLLTLVVCPSTAQSRKISLSQRQMPVSQAFAEIERQTDLIFTVNHSIIDVNQTVSFSRDQLTLTQALNQLTRTVGLEYRIVKQHIVLIKPEKKIARAKKKAAEDAVEEVPDVEDLPLPLFIPQEEVTVPDTVRIPYSFSSQGPEEYPLPGNLTKKNPGRYPGVKEQPKWAVKTNLLYGATLTPNIGIEVATGIQTTLNLSGGYNPWNVDGTYDNNDKFAHRLVQAEFRYWPCERFNRSFWGVHAFGTDFNIAGYDVPLLFKKEYRYEGWAVGAGINYGYHMILKNRWSLEFTVGVGAAYMDYDRYPCDKCEQKDKEVSKWYFGPTKLGISLVFMIK